MGVADAVEDRVAQVDVRRGHVDLGAQRTGAVRELAGLHAGEQVEVLFHGAVAERAVLARLGQAAAVFAHLVGIQIADEGLAGLDQLDGPVMQLVEVIGGVAFLAGPLEAQPLDIGLDRVDVFLVFLGRVGVVETQVALAAELLGQAEIQADALGVTDVQVTVGLRREAGDDLGVLATVQIGLDDGAQEIRGFFDGGLAHVILNLADMRHRVGRLGQSPYDNQPVKPPTERLHFRGQNASITDTAMIKLHTNHGVITLNLFEDKAPETVANFKQYVKDGHYDGTIFHRVISNFMIQGGGFEPGMQQKSTRAPIKNEANNGVANKVGTIAMARTMEPHSASAQFFINVADNSFLNHSAPTVQGWGYAVFGEVVEGMDVVNAIKGVATTSRMGHQDVPVEDVIIEKAEIIE